MYQYLLYRHSDAEREYLTAIQFDPKFARPHIGLGRLYQEHLGRYADAEQEYLAAIQLDSEKEVVTAGSPGCACSTPMMWPGLGNTLTQR